MSDPTAERKQRSYFSWLGPGDSSVVPSYAQDNYLKYSYESVTMWLCIPFKHVLSYNATKWDQMSSNKKSSQMVEVYSKLLDMLCYFTEMNGDRQVDVKCNNIHVPAQIIYSGPIPSANENEPPVAMMFSVTLQGYNRVHHETVEAYITMINAAAATNARNAHSDARTIVSVKAPTPKEIAQQQALERDRRGPDVILDWARHLCENTHTHHSQESGHTHKKYYTKHQDPAKSVEYSFSNMNIAEYNRICALFKGIHIDRDSCHVGSISSRYMDGNGNMIGNPCNPISILSLDTFMNHCRQLGAHPSYYSNLDNYPREGSHEVQYPLNGKHFYRLRYTDTHPGHGNIHIGQHGILDTFFPQFPKPSLQTDPNIGIFNLLNNRPADAEVDPVCQANFNLFIDIDSYERDTVLAAQMQKKFADIQREFKDDPEGKHIAMSKAQDDGIDALFSYFHRTGDVSDSQRCVLEYWEDFLERNNGSAHLLLTKTTNDISYEDNKITSVNESLDAFFQVRTLHQHLMLCILSAFIVCALQEAMQLNLLFAGSQGTGKSWCYFAIQKLLIKGTIIKMGSQSEKSDTDGTNKASDRVQIQDEINHDWFGTKHNTNTNGSTEQNTSARTAQTKSNLTAGESSMSRLAWDDTLKKFVTVIYTTLLHIAYWIAMNGSPQKTLEEAMQDRFEIENIMNEQASDFHEQRAIESDNNDIKFKLCREKFYDRMRHNQALFVLCGRCYKAGIFPHGIDISACMDEFYRVEKRMSKENNGLQPLGQRLKERYRLICTALTLWMAVSKVFESEISSEYDPATKKGKLFTRYSLKKVQEYLIGTPEIAIFAWRLMTSQVEPRITVEILTQMKDGWFQVDDYSDIVAPVPASEAPVPAPQPVAQPQQPKPKSVFVCDSKSQQEDAEMDALLSEQFEMIEQDEFKHQSQPIPIEIEENNEPSPPPPQEPVTATTTTVVTKRKRGYQEMRDGMCAFIHPADDFYIERAYGDDKLYSQPHLRQRGLAVSICNNRLQRIGIVPDDIEAILMQLQKRKYKDEKTQEEKCGLLYRTTSVIIAKCAFAGLHKGDKLLTYLDQTIDKDQLLPYSGVLLGSMDPKARSHYHLYNFHHPKHLSSSSTTISSLVPVVTGTAAAAIKPKKKHRIAVNTRFAAPGTMAILAACVGEDVNDNNASIVQVFDNNPVIIHDESLYIHRNLLMRDVLGLTERIIATRTPFTTHEFNQRLDLVMSQNNKTPQFTYATQFIDIDFQVKRLMDILDNKDQTPAHKINEITTLPRMSTSLDRCISEITRDSSLHPIHALRKQLSLKEQSDKIRSRLSAPFGAGGGGGSQQQYHPRHLIESLGLDLVMPRSSPPLRIAPSSSPSTSSSSSSPDISDDAISISSVLSPLVDAMDV